MITKMLQYIVGVKRQKTNYAVSLKQQHMDPLKKKKRLERNVIFILGKWIYE